MTRRVQVCVPQLPLALPDDGVRAQDALARHRARDDATVVVNFALQPQNLASTCIDRCGHRPNLVEYGLPLSAYEMSAIAFLHVHGVAGVVERGRDDGAPAIADGARAITGGAATLRSCQFRHRTLKSMAGRVPRHGDEDNAERSKLTGNPA